MQFIIQFINSLIYSEKYFIVLWKQINPIFFVSIEHMKFNIAEYKRTLSNFSDKIDRTDAFRY
ncbi:hypothetical protein GCM10008921_16100 [Metaclostridioides mangenotii]